MASVPPPSGSEPLLRPELPDGLAARARAAAARRRRPGATGCRVAAVGAVRGDAGDARGRDPRRRVRHARRDARGLRRELGRPAAGRDDHRHVLPGRRADPLRLAARAADRRHRRRRASSACAGSSRCAASGGCSARGWCSSPSRASGPRRSASRRTTTCRRSSAPTTPRPRSFFVAVLVCVAAPIAEELFFRGFCFTALRALDRRRGRRDRHGRDLRRSSTPARPTRSFLVPLGRLRRAAVRALPPHRLAAAVHGPARAQQLARARRLPELGAAAGDRADGRRRRWRCSRSRCRSRAARLRRPEPPRRRAAPARRASRPRRARRASGRRRCPRAGSARPRSSAPSPPRSRSAAPATPIASAASSRSGRIAPSHRRVASSAVAARAERALDDLRRRASGGSARPSSSARASPWTSAARPATEPRRACASIARSSIVPSLGCGRRSHHRNV